MPFYGKEVDKHKTNGGPTPTHGMLRIVLHGTVAAVMGYMILHPVSMLITVHSEQSSSLSVWTILANAFLPAHINMALYFTLLSTGYGIISGLFASKTAKLNTQLEVLSLTDTLTSLYNRRHLMRCLHEEMALAQKHSSCLSLIMIDVDHFKCYNDKHGHLQGDILLQNLAKQLRVGVREDDMVARYGGEEFIVVMRKADRATAFQQAERLCGEVASQSLIGEKSEVLDPVTISLGVAEFPSDARNVDELIQRADAELYRAKADGRNRAYVCSSIG